MTLRPDAAKPGTPVILGVPFDANSSWLRGAAGAPPIIRVALIPFHRICGRKPALTWAPKAHTAMPAI